MENRFFFEDEGHVRRLTTRTTNAIASRYGFELVLDYYANQYFGGLEWITTYDIDFVRDIADPRRASGPAQAARLTVVRLELVALKVLRKRAADWTLAGLDTHIQSDDPLKQKLKKVLYRFCLRVDSFARYKAEREWQAKKRLKNGSEMFLGYRRTGRQDTL
jgi:hypothetical protein